MIDGEVSAAGFLDVAEPDAEAQALFAEDVADLGYVMNATRLWAYRPVAANGLFDLIRGTAATYGLSVRECGILIAACASTLGDSYCSLAWGSRLAAAADEDTAAGCSGATTRGSPPANARCPRGRARSPAIPTHRRRGRAAAA